MYGPSPTHGCCCGLFSGTPSSQVLTPSYRAITLLRPSSLFVTLFYLRLRSIYFYRLPWYTYLASLFCHCFLRILPFHRSLSCVFDTLHLAQMDSPATTELSPPATPQSASYCTTPTYNPYQRVASRRAISCVTCAKAKTKCDKGVSWRLLLYQGRTDHDSSLHVRDALRRASNAFRGLLGAHPIIAIGPMSKNHL